MVSSMPPNFVFHQTANDTKLALMLSGGRNVHRNACGGFSSPLIASAAMLAAEACCTTTHRCLFVNVTSRPEPDIYTATSTGFMQSF